MLPEYIISKFKSRIGSLYSPHSRLQQYLHSRRRYYNSIPLLSIVANPIFKPNSVNLTYDQATTPICFAKGVRSLRASMQCAKPVTTGLSDTSRAKSYGVVASMFLLLGLFSLISSNSCYATTTATLELGTSNLSTTVTQGDVAYLSSTISATTTDTESYTLTITGPTNLTGASTISGANGNTPANMANNTWGYSYNQTGDNSTKTYSSFTGSAQELESGTIANGTAKDITFAAKFGSDAVSGHYSAEVKLSLVATPAAVSGVEWLWSTDGTSVGINSGITTMQEMTPEICAQVATPTAIQEADKTKAPTLKLVDSRDDNEYTIAKLPDGKCWMTQNLRLPGNTNLANASGNALTPNDTDITTNYALPTSLTDDNLGNNTGDACSKNFYNGGNNSNISCYYKAQSYITTPSTKAGPTGYYSWTAATAGTGNTDITTQGKNASSSICPKGWKLPTGYVIGDNATNDFYNLFKNMNLGVSSSLSATSGAMWDSDESKNRLIAQGSPYNFAYPGSMVNGSHSNATTYGYWWSRTAYSSTDAYYLRIASNAVSPGVGTYYRSGGFAVRCIAQ